MKFHYRKQPFIIEGFSRADRIYHVIRKTRNFYEIDLLEYMFGIKAFLGPDNSVAIDVGANIGNHAIYFRTFLVDHVIAFEPNTNVLPILQKNLQQNINHFDVYSYALGKVPGKGNIFVPGDAENNIGRAKVEIIGENEAGAKVVDIHTLDAVIDDWQQSHGHNHHINLIKIDVEGMELAVLQGATETLSRYKPHVFVEAATESEFSALDNFLKTLGYAALSRWAGTPVYHFAHEPSQELINESKRQLSLRKVRKLLRRVKRYTSLS